MTTLMHNPAFRFLSDLRLAAAILAVFAVAAGVGTWIESHYANLGSLATGRAAVYELVYDAPWFNGLLILLFVNLLTNLVRWLLLGRRPVGFLLVHVGMLLILAGAGVTRWWGYEGMVTIREGESSSTAASNEVFAVAAAGEDEAPLSVRLFRPGPQAHRTDVELGGETLTLGVSEFWPRFEWRLVPGPGGVARVELDAGGAQGSDPFALHQGEGIMLGGVELRFHQEELPAIPDRHVVDFARRDDTVFMRPTFPIGVGSLQGGNEIREFAADEIVPVEAGQLIMSKVGFQVAIRGVATSLVEDGASSADPDAPAAARIYVEKDGERAEAICLQGHEPQMVELGGRRIGLRYGPVHSELPYSLHLEDFVLETYPGSDNPASYESHVLLDDPERGITGRPHRIWMNHPLNHRGTKHFQSSYDRDRLGTILAINRDPGKTTTYVGYTVISLGFLVIFVQIISRRVAALRALAKTVAVAVCMLAAAGGASAEPPELTLSPENLEAASRLVVQDFRGRMKPLDTLARETAVKITKRERFEGREPVETFLGFALYPEAWYGHPTIHVKNPGVQALLGIDRDVHHVPLSELLREDGYRLRDMVEEAHRTPANRRDKTQQKLVVFDERVHLLFGALQGNPLRIFPIPDDPGATWQTIEKVLAAMPEEDERRAEYERAAGTLFEGLLDGDEARIGEGLRLVHALQHRYGAAVIPSDLRLDAELTLNATRPFVVSALPYLLGFVLLIIAFFVGLFSRRGGPWSWRSPLYLLGMTAFLAGFGIHLWGFTLRWIASARAPLSNGHESLLWVALAVALAGVLFEVISRTAAVGALASLLTAVVLGVSMMGTFDPSIGPLMPVLASYWLNIHVTVITASYGFLGLSCLLGLLTMVLFVIERRGASPATVRIVGILDQLNVDVMIVGVGLLTVGTLLGGVWANESWGRYWGWDPKETWALVSILIYAMILHFRWIPRLANPYVQAAGSFLAIWSIVMTYFGVNYLLMGMHSYAAGDKVAIPLWVTVSCLLSVAFSIVAHRAWAGRRDSWRRSTC